MRCNVERVCGPLVTQQHAKRGAVRLMEEVAEALGPSDSSLKLREALLGDMIRESLDASDKPQRFVDC